MQKIVSLLFVSALFLAGAGCVSGVNTTLNTSADVNTDAQTGAGSTDANSAANTGASAGANVSGSADIKVPVPTPAVTIGNAVSIKGYAFDVATLSTTAGMTVVWTNNDSVAHSVTAVDDSFDSGLISAGQTYSHTFSKAGTFAYYCKYHPSMKGVVVVK